ncbi:MAG: type II toxin-antitoxin system RelE/ParE family toxin [Alphaproteobacteria bacterium]|nr:type II toxin-antitoxin system RelE/ParE family toxin [Alphaproteobacteria bacterium]
MTRYKLSFTAQADLDGAFDPGLDAFGIAQARRYMAEILKTIELLATFPQMAPERTEAVEPVRVHHHQRHYIVYSVGDDHIVVLRIIRDETDIAALLRGLI